MVAQRILADGDFVVVEARGANVTKTGAPYNNNYCFVFRLAGGKLAEVTEYMDTELVTAALGDPSTAAPTSTASRIG
jgi:ketosteroid isomerase-like protein